jgi:hypothetical protein
LGARVNGIHEVAGSIPASSTNNACSRKSLNVCGMITSQLF